MSNVRIDVIRNNGREFERKYSCLNNDKVAEAAARQGARNVGMMAEPRVWKQAEGEWHLKFYSVD